METLMFQDLDSNQTLVEDHLFFEEHLDGFGITVAGLYLVVCVLGLAGNLLVIVAILKLDKMSSSTTVYIFNLSVADGLFMIGLPFIASQNFQNHWVFGNTACKAVMVLDGINQFTSVFCLTVMSVDRCMALLEPLRLARWRTPRCAKIISGFLWLFSLLTILPMALHFSADRGLCIPDSISDSWWLGVLSYTFALGFALPYTIMLSSYTAMLITMRSRRLQASAVNHESARLERQMTKMVVAVVVMFGVCWLPFYTFNFYSLYHGGLALTLARAFELVVLLSYSWSCANPILYACLSDSLRRHFRSLLCPMAKSSPSMQCDTERSDLTDSVRDVTTQA
ncbi:somatostatin receptor type 2 [Oryzias melastigma]|uniref:somatostatin receptor type 2 n=1 Tax=Oryzias melastigma TaxID=30732 RepID=UPI000CF8045B|nr:somatostatin receptor type 2 [Oryzias melastigma]